MRGASEQIIAMCEAIEHDRARQHALEGEIVSTWVRSLTSDDARAEVLSGWASMPERRREELTDADLDGLSDPAAVALLLSDIARQWLGGEDARTAMALMLAALDTVDLALLREQARRAYVSAWTGVDRPMEWQAYVATGIGIADALTDVVRVPGAWMPDWN